jgi:hypothetical protein
VAESSSLCSMMHAPLPQSTTTLGLRVRMPGMLCLHFYYCHIIWLESVNSFANQNPCSSVGSYPVDPVHDSRTMLD